MRIFGAIWKNLGFIDPSAFKEEAQEPWVVLAAEFTITSTSSAISSAKSALLILFADVPHHRNQLAQHESLIGFPMGLLQALEKFIVYDLNNKRKSSCNEDHHPTKSYKRGLCTGVLYFYSSCPCLRLFDWKHWFFFFFPSKFRKKHFQSTRKEKGRLESPPTDREKNQQSGSKKLLLMMPRRKRALL